MLSFPSRKDEVGEIRENDLTAVFIDFCQNPTLPQLDSTQLKVTRVDVRLTPPPATIIQHLLQTTLAWI